MTPSDVWNYLQVIIIMPHHFLCTLLFMPQCIPRHPPRSSSTQRKRKLGESRVIFHRLHAPQEQVWDDVVAVVQRYRLVDLVVPRVLVEDSQPVR